MAERQARENPSSPDSASSAPKKRSRSGTGNEAGAGTNSEGHARPKRVQVPRACHRCKRLQKGCSEQRPCQRCVKADLADECIQGSSSSIELRPRSLVDNSSPQPIVPRQSFLGTLHEDHSQKLPPAEVVEICFDRFFTQLCPTIPILTESYTRSLRLRASLPESGCESCGTIIAVCAMVLLQVEEPERFTFEGIIPAKNSAYGRQLFDQALEIHRLVRRQSVPTFDQVLLTFFIYACHGSQFHHSRAFFFLREAATLLLLLRPEPEDATTKVLAERLFWVVLVSERSHAIRYRRPITLQVTQDTPAADGDPDLTGFWSLVALFRPLDTSVIALLNRETLACPPSAAALTHVEAEINRAVDHTAKLLDTQKSNLRVTQLWLRIILWQLRLHHGHLSENARPLSLTYHYPLDVAKDLTLSIRDLPVDSIRVHGVGLTEKLFDIACSVVDVLARIPLTQTDKYGVGGRPEDNLRYLRRIISLLPGGDTIYDNLLRKHIQQTLPGLEV